MQAEQEELARLRQENAVLKQERYFLRSAAAFFPQESR
jgi:transposase-like protein